MVEEDLYYTQHVQAYLTMIARPLTAVVHCEQDLYGAECPEVGSVSQGATPEEAVANLKEATESCLEAFGPTDFSRPFMATFDVSVHA